MPFLNENENLDRPHTKPKISVKIYIFPYN